MAGLSPAAPPLVCCRVFFLIVKSSYRVGCGSCAGIGNVYPCSTLTSVGDSGQVSRSNRDTKEHHPK